MLFVLLGDPKDFKATSVTDKFFKTLIHHIRINDSYLRQKLNRNSSDKWKRRLSTPYRRWRCSEVGQPVLNQLISSFRCPSSLAPTRCSHRRTLLWERNGGAPGTFYEMAFHPGSARQHAVTPLRNRSRQGALLPTAGRQPNPRHGPETQCVSFSKETLGLLLAGKTGAARVSISLQEGRCSFASFNIDKRRLKHLVASFRTIFVQNGIRYVAKIAVV